MEAISLSISNGFAAGLLGAVSANGVSLVNKALMYVREQDIDKLDRSKLRIIVETAGFAIVFAMIEFMVENPVKAVFIMTIFTVLYGVGVCDSIYKIIPNEYVIVITLIAAIMLNSGYSSISAANAIAGGAAGILIFIYPYMKSAAFGGGDVKLCAAAGLIVGLGGLLAAIVSMGIILIIYTFYMLVKTKNVVLTKMIPIGPILTVCIFIQIILLDIMPDYGRFI